MPLSDFLDGETLQGDVDPLAYQHRQYGGKHLCGANERWSISTTTTDNEVLNNSTSAVDVTFDRNMNPASITPLNVVNLIGTLGPIGPFTMNVPAAINANSTLNSSLVVNNTSILSTLSVDVNVTFPQVSNLSITLISPNVVQAAAVNVGGSGYIIGDIVTVVGGVDRVPAELRVNSVAAGVITSVTVIQPGDYSTLPTNPVTVTGGSGTLATFSLSFLQAQIPLVSAGALSGVNLTNTDFDDSGTTPIGSGAAPYSGIFRPAPGVLSTLANGIRTLAGTWQLQIVNSGANTGTLTNWSLIPFTVTASTVANSAPGQVMEGTVPGRTFRITFPTQSVSGTYTVTLGPDSTGNYAKDTVVNTATAVSSGNNLYVVGDMLTRAGRDVYHPAEFMVAAVDATGAITKLELVQPGSYSVDPPAGTTTTTNSAAGSGATVTLLFGNEVDTNLNAGLDLLRGGDPFGVNGTLVPNTYNPAIRDFRDPRGRRQRVQHRRCPERAGRLVGGRSGESDGDAGVAAVGVADCQRRQHRRRLQYRRPPHRQWRHNHRLRHEHGPQSDGPVGRHDHRRHGAHPGIVHDQPNQPAVTVNDLPPVERPPALTFDIGHSPSLPRLSRCPQAPSRRRRSRPTRPA